jgi:hypothetical protein
MSIIQSQNRDFDIHKCPPRPSIDDDAIWEALRNWWINDSMSGINSEKSRILDFVTLRVCSQSISGNLEWALMWKIHFQSRFQIRGDRSCVKETPRRSLPKLTR